MTEIERILTELAQELIINNLRHLNQGIEDFNNLLSRDPEVALQNLSMLSKEDQQTPAVVIEAMIDAAGWKLPDGTLNKEDIYLDPCCGRGGILAYLHSHYNIPKENLYGIDIKKENVVLCRKLGFNVIRGNATDSQVYADITNLVRQVKGDSMIAITKEITNPPYAGNLHLKILDVSKRELLKYNPNAEVVCIHPARWLISTLDRYNAKSDFNTFKDISNSLSGATFIDPIDSCRLFKANLETGLVITYFNPAKQNMNLNIVPQIVFNILDKIKAKTVDTINNHIECEKLDGWRVEIKRIGRLGVDMSHLDSDSEYHRTQAVKLCPDIAVFKDGYYKDGKKWYDKRQKGKTYEEDEPIAVSIKTGTENEANNLRDSLHTEFYKTLMFISKFDQNSPIKFLPYMVDYTAPWTNERFCEYYNLTAEESEFMCRVLTDYRRKDFINYINIKED